MCVLSRSVTLRYIAFASPLFKGSIRHPFTAGCNLLGIGPQLSREVFRLHTRTVTTGVTHDDVLLSIGGFLASHPAQEPCLDMVRT